MRRQIYLLYVLFGVALYALNKFAFFDAVFSLFGAYALTIKVIISLGLLFALAMIIRARLRTLNLSPHWIWLTFVPIIGWYIQAYMITHADSAGRAAPLPNVGSGRVNWPELLRRFLIMQIIFWPVMVPVGLIGLFFAFFIAGAVSAAGYGEKIGGYVFLIIMSLLSIAVFTSAWLLSFVVYGNNRPSVFKDGKKRLFTLWVLTIAPTITFVYMLFHSFDSVK